MMIAHVLIARQLRGLPVGEADIAELPEPAREIARRLIGANGNGSQIFTAAIDELITDVGERQDLWRRVFAIDPAEPQPTESEANGPQCPELPEAARLSVTPAHGWLDDYCNYAEALSPMTPRLFHESAGLWLSALVIARRLVLKMPYGEIYPNLFFLWIAQTTLYRKTTALDIARKMARDHFRFLLAPQDTTPEALLSDMAGKEPANWEKLSMQEQAEWQTERHFAAQRGLALDELSGLLAGAGKDYNAGLLEAYLRFYDCDPVFTRSTRGQGRLTIANAYLSILGASTPNALAAHLTADRLWAMGFWPRFALLTPEGRPEWKEPPGADLPVNVIGGLQKLYKRLPAVEWPNPPGVVVVTLGDSVYQAWERYNKALSFELLTDDLDRRLFGTYGRLPTLALKVAMNLAAMDWRQNISAPRVDLPHWERAQAIAESWRASAHRTLSGAAITEFSNLAQRIMRQAAKYEPNGATMRELCRAMSDKRPAEIKAAVSELLTVGQLEEQDARRNVSRVFGHWQEEFSVVR